MQKIKSFLFIFLLMAFVKSHAQKGEKTIDKSAEQKKEIIKNLDGKYGYYKEQAMAIWNFAEVGFQEEKSSSLLQQILKDQGFDVRAGVAGMPTAFIASYGSGSPVIGILAEYDALPGMSQTKDPVKTSIDGKNAGHACGHHLFGVASVAAAIEIKKLIEQKIISGTIRLYGCPAEEGGSGKVYLTRDGLFNDLDVAIHWHAGDDNEVTMTSALANKSAKFRFKGIAAHASASPEKGRSALDAVEAMNNMVNMMREHIPHETRIHYVITSGGKAPNIVPDYAEVYYYVRHPKKEDAKNIFERVVKAAQGAAVGTETIMDYEIIGGTHDLLLNRSLGELMQKNLNLAGSVQYSNADIEFAKKIQASFNFSYPAIETAGAIKPLKVEVTSAGGSTDVGDVSYTVPTVGMSAASWVPGTPAHSWQAVASGGTDIGTKGMLVAAKTMAMSALDLFLSPGQIAKAKEEFIKAKGDYKYVPLLGDRKPALNYRN